MSSKKRPASLEEQHSDGSYQFLAAKGSGLSVPVTAYRVPFEKNENPVHLYQSLNYPVSLMRLNSSDSPMNPGNAVHPVHSMHPVHHPGHPGHPIHPFHYVHHVQHVQHAQHAHTVAAIIAQNSQSMTAMPSLVQTVAGQSMMQREAMPVYSLPSSMSLSQQQDSSHYGYTTPAVLRVASLDAIAHIPRFNTIVLAIPRRTSLASIDTTANGTFNLSATVAAENSAAPLLSTLPSEYNFSKKISLSFSNISEYFDLRGASLASRLLLKLRSTQSLTSQSSLSSLSQLQRMTPLKPIITTSRASINATTVPQQNSLSHLNLEFAQANKKSRPNSPVPSMINLGVKVPCLSTSAQMLQGSGSGHSLFLISPDETPLQTPQQSPHLLAQSLGDKGLNSISSINKLENEQNLHEQNEQSIAVNGTTLPPIRSVLNSAEVNH